MAERILLVIIALIILEVVLVYIILPLAGYLRRINSPVRQVHARVLLSQQLTTMHVPGWLLGLPFYRRSWYWRSRDVPDANAYMYMVTFELDDYSRLEFTIREEELSVYQPDDEGTLTYRGDRILSFARTQPGQPEAL